MGGRYVQIAELTQELVRREDEATLVKGDVPTGARLRFEFTADVPVDMSLEAITFREKVFRTYRSAVFMPFGGVVRSLDNMIRDGPDTIACRKASEWSLEYTSDEVQDLFAVARLPRGVSRAKVSIRMFEIGG
jgi:hypothetical protein